MILTKIPKITYRGLWGAAYIFSSKTVWSQWQYEVLTWTNACNFSKVSTVSSKFNVPPVLNVIACFKDWSNLTLAAMWKIASTFWRSLDKSSSERFNPFCETSPEIHSNFLKRASPLGKERILSKSCEFMTGIVCVLGIGFDLLGCWSTLLLFVSVFCRVSVELGGRFFRCSGKISIVSLSGLCPWILSLLWWVHVYRRTNQVLLLPVIMDNYWILASAFAKLC